MITNKKFIVSVVSFFSLFLFFISVDFCVAQQPAPIITNYTYDPSGQRITVSNGTKTTVYPTKNYNVESNTQNLPPKVTKHIFANGQDLATIQGSGAIAKIYYNSADLLNSSNIMIDSTGAISETLDYFPFGGIRIDDKVGTFNEQRKYIGQEFDPDTGLNYLNARYYDGKLGRFISEDPQFWGQQNLSDPQSLNSYSYANNNPIRLSDPSGLKPEPLQAAVMLNQMYNDGSEGANLIGNWSLDSLFRGTSNSDMKLGVYSRTINESAQNCKLEYALVGKGTVTGMDWLNNFQQLSGISPDMKDAINFTKEFKGSHPGIETTNVGHSKSGPEAAAGAILNGNNAMIFNSAALNTNSHGIKSALSTYGGKIDSYVTRDEILIAERAVLGNIGNTTYLPSQYNLSMSQIRQHGLLPSLYSNSTQNHSMRSVISGLSK